MTTRVKITAEVHQHDRIVRVDITNNGSPAPAIFLDGDNASTEVYVYDNQIITISEVVKEAKPADAG